MLLNSPTSKDAYDQCFVTATKKQVRTPSKSPEVGHHLIKSAHIWISNFQLSELWKKKFLLFPSCPKYPDKSNLETKRICFSSQNSGYSPSLQGSQGSTCLKKLGHIRSEAEEREDGFYTYLSVRSPSFVFFQDSAREFCCPHSSHLV